MSDFLTSACEQQPSRHKRRFLAVCALVISAIALLPIGVIRAQTDDLREPLAFAGIADRGERSRALYGEIAKVVMHPRCINCHPADDRPTQGNDRHQHFPPVTRGSDGGGVPGNSCGACHGERNYTLIDGVTYQSIPGHPRWGLAPIEMAWQGKSAGEICRQLKDPQRNGGRTLALLHEHLAHDDLVAWG
jgi:hypothetical protein